jgi:hypothetical protein
VIPDDCIGSGVESKGGKNNFAARRKIETEEGERETEVSIS